MAWQVSVQPPLKEESRPAAMALEVDAASVVYRGTAVRD